MNTFIDESGLFVPTQNRDSWNVVSALTVTENEVYNVKQILSNLKKENGFPSDAEIKLKNVTEDSYLKFLNALSNTLSALFVTTTDSSLSTRQVILEHKKNQVAAILKNINKMRYIEGREALEQLAERINKLSLQLYVQIQCQIKLLVSVINKSILFYVQRIPDTLSQFHWYIDKKNSYNFEKGFEILSPFLLQSKSLRNPIIMVKEFDYSPMKKYLYTKDNCPSYLEESYGIKANGGLNIQKIIREDINFVDSEQNYGIQLVDLLASGVRRCLRQKFSDNKQVASSLGSLMIQGKNNKPPLDIISFENTEKAVGEIEELIIIMKRSCKSMFEKS